MEAKTGKVQKAKSGKVQKTFNKRAYLKQKLKTNFGSQQEGHGRAYLQKKAVVRQYYRQQRREEEKQRKKLNYDMGQGKDGVITLKPSNELAAATYDYQDSSDSDEESPFSQPAHKKRLGSMQKARAAYHKKITEKKQKKEDFLRKQQEIEEAKEKYKEKRLQRFKKLSKKNRRGQPIMSGRIELMLEELQEEMKS